MQVEERSSGYKLRSILLKLIIIIAIVALLIWILPKFVGYKKTSNKLEENSSKTVSVSKFEFESNQLKLRDAALKYYGKDKIPVDVGQKSKLTLDQLQKEKVLSEIVDDENRSCNVSESYVELTRLDNDYLLKVSLVCGEENDYKIFHVGEYEYCDNTLCEKSSQREVEISKGDIQESYNKEEIMQKDDGHLEEETKKDDSEEKQEEQQETENSKKSDSTILSDFGKWSNYERVSCGTKEVVCSLDDTSCLEEVKIYKRTEKVGEKKISYSAQLQLLEKISQSQKKLCSNYNYLEINNKLYYTSGDYAEVLRLNKSSTSNWNYDGKIVVDKNLVSNVKKYYKFLGVNYESCQDDCTKNIKYYYDVYTYKHNLILADSQNCSNETLVTYPVYSLKISSVSRTDTKPIYATACYKSIRTRNIQKN